MLALAGCATTTPSPQAPIPAGSRYVAMGSSYAAGAGIGPLTPDSPTRCGRTVNNYAHLLAARLRLDLADVSCGRAVTTNILAPWNELPAQIDAVTADARLVTVTIGGNDVNFVRDLFVTICTRKDAEAGRPCRSMAEPTETLWSTLEQRLREIAREVKTRAPGARLIFVDYLKVIPDDSLCDTIPLGAEQAAKSRRTFSRLAALTAKVAKEEGADLLPAGMLSNGHEACSLQPWAVGFPVKEASPWHPTAAGHAAVADELAKMLSR
ncbi:MAG TPA: SGNH/GDSL hydrolase family protein [Sphingobium sp.]